MGAYSSQPVTDCESFDSETTKIRYGASSMQGWRRTQEDALNCAADFDSENDSMLFAVYDGHGGAEVAEYCAKNLPAFIKQLPSYIDGDIEKALIDAFVQFDERLISEETVEKLKLISNRPISPVPSNVLRLQKNHQLWDDDDDDEDEDDDNDDSNVLIDEASAQSDEDETAALLEDACTPIDQVLKKMTNGEITAPAKQANHTTDNGESSSGTSGKPSVGTSEDSSSSGQADAAQAGGSGLASSAPAASSTADGSDSDSDSSGPDYNLEAESSDDDDSDDEETMEQLKASQEMALKFTESEDYLHLPGSDSGCTACLALLRSNAVYVANAGDSRCVLCRAGKAIDLSLDHKPEDEPERQRIEKAGGFVTVDGRVNGNLNLSRALGDHNYKRNKEISLSEQMITPLPDIKKEYLTPDDEFLIIACDGIWNSLSSQECVDFVRMRIERGEKISTICEEMFHSVLADDTMEGDGTGCDNMTCIIIDLQKAKRPDIKNERTSSTGFDHTGDDDSPVLPNIEEPPNKLQKTE